MKIVYLGYDVLLCCLEAIHAAGHEVMKIYTIPSDGRYDKSEDTVAFGERWGIPVSLRRFDRPDVEALLLGSHCTNRMRRPWRRGTWPFPLKNARNTPSGTVFLRFSRRKIHAIHRQIPRPDLCSGYLGGCELLICAGYPYKVPVDPRLPAINLHPALLPIGRGPWPMPVTILRGLTSSGVTLHKLAERFDAGDMIAQEAFPVAPDETLLTLTEKIKACSVRLLTDCLGDFERLFARAVPQDPARAEYWPEPTLNERTVRLSMGAADIDRVVRAFAGFGCMLETARGLKPMDMPRFREIRLSDRERVQAICAANGNTASPYAFATLYCWQETLGLNIYLEDDWFVVRMGESDYYFPCGYAERTEVFLRGLLYGGRPFRLGYVTAELRQPLERAHPELTFAAAREDFDYIVPIKRLALLEGKHYRTIRKQIHHFERGAVLSWEDIALKNLHVVRSVSEKWDELYARQEDGADARAEHCAISHYEQLGMQGILAKKDGVPFGFVMGSRCGEKMIDVHFAKCLDRSPGADFFIKKSFCRRFMDVYADMNMEDDMGLPGLRTRKLMYHPAALTEFFIATYSGGAARDGE